MLQSRLPCGTRITVTKAFTGAVEFTAVLGQDQDTETYSYAVLIYLLKRYKLPHPCASISWQLSKKEEVIVCNGMLFFHRITLMDYEKLGIGRKSNSCLLCSLPCNDADDKPNTRHLNCVRCEPCFLCTNCRVFLPMAKPPGCISSGKSTQPVCLWCVKPEEEDELSESMRFRKIILD